MDLSRHARRITLVLFLAQSAGSAGLISASTVNPLIGEKLGGTPALAGGPAAVYLIGSALSAVMWGTLMSRYGRRPGLLGGLLFGLAGAILSWMGVNQGSLSIFLTGMLLLGAAQAALQLGRFAAADVYPPMQRGQAISNVVLGGAVGAVLGPLMVGPLGRFVSTLGFDELSGPFPGIFGLFMINLVLIYFGLRPEPRDLARLIAEKYPENHLTADSAHPVGALAALRRPAAALAVATMLIGQVVMVFLMVITALHMKHNQHGLGQVSLVISSHTFGMFAFSILSGRLADRFGRAPVILAGALILIAACLSATLSPDVFPLAVALFLLGLGWNLCFVGGSSLLADQLAPAERARAQGVNDLLVGLASAASSLSSGLVYARLGYNGMALLGAGASLLLALLIGFWSLRRRRAVEISPVS